MAISNDLLSSTLYSIRDSEVDQLYRKTAFLDLCKQNGGIEYENVTAVLSMKMVVLKSNVLSPLLITLRSLLSPLVMSRSASL